jgi:toxin ParE1/3/4
MPGKPVRLAPLAEADLEGIWRYTSAQWSREQADSYLRDLAGAFLELASGTRTGKTSDVRPGYLKCLCGSHVVYYRNHADRLDVIRVLHQRQDAERNL